MGLSTLGGHLVNEPVAQAHNLAYRDPKDLLLGGLSERSEPVLLQAAPERLNLLSRADRRARVWTR